MNKNLSALKCIILLFFGTESQLSFASQGNFSKNSIEVKVAETKKFLVNEGVIQLFTRAPEIVLQESLGSGPFAKRQSSLEGQVSYERLILVAIQSRNSRCLGLWEHQKLLQALLSLESFYDGQSILDLCSDGLESVDLNRAEWGACPIIQIFWDTTAKFKDDFLH